MPTRPLLPLLLLALPTLAQDLTGIWVGEIGGGRNGIQDIAFKLTQKGNIISGKLYGDYQSNPIIEGKIENGELNFVVLAQEQAPGNVIVQTRMRFLGCIRSSGELELTRERERSVNATNSGAAAAPRRGEVKQTFFVKRLL